MDSHRHVTTAMASVTCVSWLSLVQAPAAEAGNGVAPKDAAKAAVEQLKQEATPSHDIYGHLPKPEENDKARILTLHVYMLFALQTLPHATSFRTALIPSRSFQHKP